MKKLLLSSVALCGLTFAAAPAMADDGVKLELGGFYKGYLAYVDQDTAPGSEARTLDWLQDTEIHFTGETTLNNGLTVGAHFEVEADNNDDFGVEESYAYASGVWGRVNAGAENGAVYLLQVSAPSADSNIDGIRQYVQPINYSLTDFSPYTGAIVAGDTLVDVAGGAAGDVLSLGSTTNSGFSEQFIFDYDDDMSGYSNKLTYMTPVFEGFQAGVSYSPELDSDGNRSTNGVSDENEPAGYGDVYEVALRYSGDFENVGFTIGAGFTQASLEDETNADIAFVDTNGDTLQDVGEGVISLDDRQSWNLGADIDVGAFGLGVAYVQDDLGVSNGADRDTLVVGADYTNGPWKLGASYYNQEQELFGVDELETDRYTGGVVYNYGPGMTFRGSISYIDHDATTFEDTDATSVVLGTQIKF